jgi:hypothetical protein
MLRLASDLSGTMYSRGGSRDCAGQPMTAPAGGAIVRL